MEGQLGQSAPPEEPIYTPQQLQQLKEMPEASGHCMGCDAETNKAFVDYTFYGEGTELSIPTLGYKCVDNSCGIEEFYEPSLVEGMFGLAKMFDEIGDSNSASFLEDHGNLLREYIEARDYDPRSPKILQPGESTSL